MLSDIIKNIREHAKRNRLNFSDHALKRMNERKIRDTQVYDCIVFGKFVEQQYHGDR